MNRNQKIALGCGGAGCLGLILVVILVVVLSATGYMSLPGSGSNINYNSNANRNSNYNSNSNANSNSNSSSSSMSDDDKHKLFQAAAATKDSQLTRRVWTKLGLLKTDGTPNDEYGQFIKDHIGWIFKNTDFVQSINTPAKARAYVNAHIDD
jgi:hypothetical protein